jgi:hypothetical protein
MAHDSTNTVATPAAESPATLAHLSSSACAQVLLGADRFISFRARRIQCSVAARHGETVRKKILSRLMFFIH